MKLVSDWKESWRWFSVWIGGAIAALPAAWEFIPYDLRAYVPQSWLPWISGVMFLAFYIGRIVDQRGRRR